MIHRCGTNIAWSLLGFVALATLLIPVFPGVPTAFEYHREWLAQSQFWRLLTGHLVHWNTEHLLWDLAVFGILSILAIRLSPARYNLCLVAAALVIPAAVWFLQPGLVIYRGLSGLDSALFVLVILRLLTLAPLPQRRIWTVLAGVALAAFAGKTLYELLTARTLFVTDLGPGITPVPLAHLVGGFLGALAACPMPYRPWTARPA